MQIGMRGRGGQRLGRRGRGAWGLGCEADVKDRAHPVCSSLPISIVYNTLLSSPVNTIYNSVLGHLLI